jgi:hypothetical protein
MLVWAHAAVFPAMPGEVVAAGADVVSHVHMLVHELSGDRPGSYRRQREHLADAYRRFLDAPVDALDPLLEDMRRRGTILDATAGLVARMPSSAPGAAELAPRVLRRLVDRARHVGVTICAGTDYETPPRDRYPSLHDELRFLVRSMGMPPHEAIRAATAAGAAAVGLGDTAGTVEPGKQADFVIVEADPYQDIDHLRRVVTTVKRGRRHDRADYDRADHDRSAAVAAGNGKGAPDGR